MRVKRERWEATGRTCYDCDLDEPEWVTLCVFDDGYISGYEAALKPASAPKTDRCQDGPDTRTTTGEDMSDTPIQDNQNLTVGITFEDAAGNPVPDAIDAGTLAASFADGSALSATPRADQTGVVVTALGPLATDDVLTVTCTVSGTPFSGTLAFDVGAGPATQMALTPGAPEENVAAAPSA